MCPAVRKCIHSGGLRAGMRMPKEEPQKSFQSDLELHLKRSLGGGVEERCEVYPIKE